MTKSIERIFLSGTRRDTASLTNSNHRRSHIVAKDKKQTPSGYKAALIFCGVIFILGVLVGIAICLALVSAMA